MRQSRRFQDLTIGDNYMFGAVMMENDNCRQLLERVLEMPISRVEVIKEKSMIYHPECKGARLDVYAKDEKKIPIMMWRCSYWKTGCASKSGDRYYSQPEWTYGVIGKQVGRSKSPKMLPKILM
ncbi:MAG: hypothetical protein V8S98_11015 [Lachnospiraceae bacterium]